MKPVCRLPGRASQVSSWCPASLPHNTQHSSTICDQAGLAAPEQTGPTSAQLPPSTRWETRGVMGQALGSTGGRRRGSGPLLVGGSADTTSREAQRLTRHLCPQVTSAGANHSEVTEFIPVGLPGSLGLHVCLLVVPLLAYLLPVTESLLAVAVIHASPALHKPVCGFLSNYPSWRCGTSPSRCPRCRSAWRRPSSAASPSRAAWCSCTSSWHWPAQGAHS